MRIGGTWFGEENSQDAPSELSCALSLAARLEWVEACAPGYPADARAYLAWDILKSLAAGDVDAARAYFVGKHRKATGGHPHSALAYNALRAILAGSEN